MFTFYQWIIFLPFAFQSVKMQNLINNLFSWVHNEILNIILVKN